MNSYNENAIIENTATANCAMDTEIAYAKYEMYGVGKMVRTNTFGTQYEYSCVCAPSGVNVGDRVLFKYTFKTKPFEECEYDGIWLVGIIENKGRKERNELTITPTHYYENGHNDIEEDIMNYVYDNRNYEEGDYRQYIINKKNGIGYSRHLARYDPTPLIGMVHKLVPYVFENNFTPIHYHRLPRNKIEYVAELVYNYDGIYRLEIPNRFETYYTDPLVILKQIL